MNLKLEIQLQGLEGTICHVIVVTSIKDDNREQNEEGKLDLGMKPVPHYDETLESC